MFTASRATKDSCLLTLKVDEMRFNSIALSDAEVEIFLWGFNAECHGYIITPYIHSKLDITGNDIY